jgi:DNA polymerase-3 subunit delta
MAQKKSGEQATLRDHGAALLRAVEEMPHIVVAAGECEFLRAAALSRLREAWLARFPGGDTVVLRGAGEARPVGLADLTAELSGGSLFAGDKLVLARQAERMLFPTAGRAGASSGAVGDEAAAAAKGGDREKAFLARLDEPAERIWLVVETAQLPKNRVLGKALAAKAFVIPCPQLSQRDLPQFLSARAAELGRRIDAAAADMLIRAHGAAPGALSAELDKLALFAPEGADIDAGAVGEFLTGTIEFDIFNFTNAVEAKDRRQAVQYARRIAEQGTRDQKGKREGGDASAHKILFMLSSSLEAMLRARTAQASGADAAAFAAGAKLPPWRAERLFAAARKFSLRELRLMAESAAEHMRRSHDTGGDAALSLELMAVKLTGGFSV